MSKAMVSNLQKCLAIPIVSKHSLQNKEARTFYCPSFFKHFTHHFKSVAILILILFHHLYVYAYKPLIYGYQIYEVHASSRYPIMEQQ